MNILREWVQNHPEKGQSRMMGAFASSVPSDVTGLTLLHTLASSSVPDGAWENLWSGRERASRCLEHNSLPLL